MSKFVLIAAAALAALVLGSTAAGSPKEAVGQEVSLFIGPAALAADTPFHIRSGWGLSPDGPANGKFDIKLQVDGVYRDASFEEHVVPADGSVLQHYWIFNFPSGMPAGQHVFAGHYIAPCWFADACTSDNPNALIEARVQILTVTFS